MQRSLISLTDSISVSGTSPIVSTGDPDVVISLINGALPDDILLWSGGTWGVSPLLSEVATSVDTNTADILLRMTGVAASLPLYKTGPNMSPTLSLAQSGASTGELLAWDGTRWNAASQTPALRLESLTVTGDSISSSTPQINVAGDLEVLGEVYGTSGYFDGLLNTNNIYQLPGSSFLAADGSFMTLHGSLWASGTATFTSSCTVGTTLGVTGISTLGVLNSGNHAVSGTLSSSGATTLTTSCTVGTTLGVTGLSSLGTLNSGNHTVTGTLSSSGATTLTTSCTVGTTLGVTGLSSLGTLNSGNHTVTGTLSSSGATTLTTSCSVGTTLAVTGASTFTSTTRHSDGLTMPCDGTSGTPIWFEDCSGSAANHHWYLDGSLKCYFNSGGGWTTVSDRRLKSNIQPIGNMLAALCRATPCRYTKHHRSNLDPGFAEEIGLIAQEIADIPELSSFVSMGGRDNDLMGINYAGMVVPVIQSIKELASRLQLLEQMIQKST